MKTLVGVATLEVVVITRSQLEAKVDGRRKRRHSQLKARREWYARHRAERFARHLGFR